MRKRTCVRNQNKHKIFIQVKLKLTRHMERIHEGFFNVTSVLNDSGILFYFIFFILFFLIEINTSYGKNACSILVELLS